MEPLKPATPEELAEALASAAAGGRTIAVDGAGSKIRLHSGAPAADLAITTTGLDRILEYEPRDLTISVEAGCRFSDLSARLAEDGLMLPLDPPFFSRTTIGGASAANVSGPRLRGFGGLRDLIIGLRFATIEGKLVQSGGMVVKNTAGLDMGKLLIGSHGTLGVITSVNFRLAPRPRQTRSFLFRHETLAAAIETRKKLTAGQLQPAAVDLLNPPAAARAGLSGYVALAQAAGTEAVIARYSRELPAAETVEGEPEARLWERIREFIPEFLAGSPAGAVVRVSTTLDRAGEIVAELETPVLARAGNGILYACFGSGEAACRWVAGAAKRGLKAVVEYAPESGCDGERWPLSGSDFTLMEKLKEMFDPNHLLNRGRLYGRL